MFWRGESKALPVSRVKFELCPQNFGGLRNFHGQSAFLHASARPKALSSRVCVPAQKAFLYRLVISLQSEKASN